MDHLLKYAGIVGTTAFRYFLFAGLAFLFFYILLYRKMLNSKIQDREASPHDFISEIVHSLQSIFILALLAFIVLFTPLRQFTLIYKNVNEFPVWWLPISFILSLLVHDTYFYWMHRLLHRKDIYKLAHKVHHLSANPSPWASYSFHIFEAFTEGFVVFIVAFLIPMHPVTLFLFTFIGFLINIYGHLGFEIMPKWFRTSILFEWINTSVYHNLHHSKVKGNFSLYFRHWDKWMKTENPDYEKVYDQIQEKRFNAILNIKHSY